MVGGLAVAVVVLSACGSSSTTPSAATAGSDTTGSGAAAASAGTVQVVASTNVWGDVAEQIGGTHVDVLSLISDPSADPHSYEANAQNQLALSKAALVVENGGGYDDFVDTMMASSGGNATVVNAVEVAGYSGDELNEHVWYDFPTVQKVAAAIADDLAAADPAHAAEYRANATAFSGKVDALIAQEQQIKATHDGAPVAITEPVPVYMLDASGLDDLTPDAFAEAIEQETDVPADVLQQTLALFADKKVDALVYNSQTSGPQTEAVLQAAKDNGIAVVPVTETLPAGQDYLGWMGSNLTALDTALGG
ncbi:zinc/manganese transport system substrate-binding protein [Nakamurella flavida]|uniref:metal ABC transporter solute-binding protein, Zn/Mn family n=1 Tax=Nakamurella flavida TaxID=363630 RepID=UPI002786E5CC|nr:zinc ABC transporter substrate-binding protein [Nakamurella flavida]MDP9778311.1 zinc/manganese transport system substrate-binding protein [Nakamurella flavida]